MDIQDIKDMENMNHAKSADFTKRQLAIVGAVCGDIIGSTYELRGRSTKDINFELFLEEDHVTDDTVLTIAILESLLTGKSYVETLRYWGNKYPDAGYGRRFREWLSSDNPQPGVGFTNGCAMRVSAVGAMAATAEQVLKLAEESAVVSHNHPEAVKGAQAAAMAVFLALHGYSKDDIRDRIEALTGYNLSRRYSEIQPGHKFDYTCPGSVPEALICFLESSDYESAIRNAIAMGGDADTMAAIAGSVAAAFYGEIPQHILSFCMPRIPREMMDLISKI